MKPSILLTYIGLHDPYNPDGTEGPVLSFLKTKEFDKIYLFYTTGEFLSRAHDLANIIKTCNESTVIDFIEIDVSTPIDYEEIFREMSNKVIKIEDKNKDLNPEYYVLTDSGTPQMQTCWFLIVASNLFKAHLIQGIPPKFGGGIYKAKEINLNFENFPIVLKPPEIDRLNKILLEEPKTETIHKDNLIGNESIFLQAKQSAIRASKYDISVMLLGESGTGKELFAKLIHNNSGRKEKPFVAINCGAINIQIAESELFGHKKGAFTGAINDKSGYFEIANGGTIFLDEIGDLPLELQSKLLRVLENGIYIPVGDTGERKTDVRVIAATNKNLYELVKKGEFRRDLFERLNQYTIKIPALVERKNDIPLLIEFFLNEWNTKYKENKTINEDVLPFLLTYTWPGNIRELRNAIMYMCASTAGTKITPASLPFNIREYFEKETYTFSSINIPPYGINLKSMLHKLEKEYYQKALKMANGNKAQAARLLGINPVAFRKSLKERFPDLLREK